MKVLVLSDINFIAKFVSRVVRKKHNLTVDAFTDSKLAVVPIQNTKYNTLVGDLRTPFLKDFEIIPNILEFNAHAKLFLIKNPKESDDSSVLGSLIENPVDVEKVIKEIEDLKLCSSL